MNVRAVSVLALLLMLFGCGVKTAHDPQSLKLPSGKEIKVVGREKIDLPEGGPVLALNYETDVLIDEKATLRKEAGEIWVVFQKEVEESRLRAGLLRATHRSGGLIPSVESHNFIFSKHDDGSWHCLEDDRE